MISAIYVFSVKGDFLLQRVYAPPAPPPHHLKALVRNLLGNRGYLELAPVLCVGDGNSRSAFASSATAVSSFTWFMPPRITSDLSPSSFASPLVLSSIAPPTTFSTAAAVASAPGAAGVGGGCARLPQSRWGGSSAVEDGGIVYVAAVRPNGNLACVLEVLRRLAALVQAYSSAAHPSGGAVDLLPNSSASSLPSVQSPSRRATSQPRSRVGSSTGEVSTADPAIPVNDSNPQHTSSWLKVRRSVSRPVGDDSVNALMPSASASPFPSSYYGSGVGGASVNELFIRRNFVLLQELLDEAVDGGYPQLLDLTTLKHFILLGSTRGSGFLPAWAADLLGSGRGNSLLLTGGGTAAKNFGSSSSSAGGPFGGLGLKRGAADKGLGLLQDVGQSKKITTQVTSACAWRASGIKYRSNEVFIDVVESVNVLTSQNGVILCADVNGQILANCKLSGMPECRFGLNDKLISTGSGTVGSATPSTRRQQQQGDQKHFQGGETGHSAANAGQATHRTNMTVSAKIQKSAAESVKPSKQSQCAGASIKTPGVVLDDCRFHQCVRLAEYDSDRVIAFIPPDGSFQLMTYRVTENLSLPFKVFPLLQERTETRMECMVLLKALFPKNLSATNVEVVIPCPPNLCGVQLTHVGAGKASHEAAQQAVVWKIKRYPGCMEYLLRYEVHLSPRQGSLLLRKAGSDVSAKSSPHLQDQQRWKKPPLTLRFTLHMFTASGVCIRYLKITEKNNYRTTKWIRYVTKAGIYQHRL